MPGPRRPRPIQTQTRPEPHGHRGWVSILLPEGRLKKRLRAAWRWRQMAGLLSLLCPFFQRFNLAEAPEGNFPERPISAKLKSRLPGTQKHAQNPRGSVPLHFLFLCRHFRTGACYRGKTVNIRFCVSSRFKIPVGPEEDPLLGRKLCC